MAGRHDRLQVDDLVAHDDDLLVTFAVNEGPGLTTRTWRSANGAGAQRRLGPWRHGRTVLRTHLRSDGAVMLADRCRGPNVAFEPAMAPS